MRCIYLYTGKFVQVCYACMYSAVVFFLLRLTWHDDQVVLHHITLYNKGNLCFRMCIFSNVRPQKAKIKISPFPHCRPSITYTVKIRKRKDKKFVFPVYSLVHKVPYTTLQPVFQIQLCFQPSFCFWAPQSQCSSFFPFCHSLTHTLDERKRRNAFVFWLVVRRWWWWHWNCMPSHAWLSLA